MLSLSSFAIRWGQDSNKAAFLRAEAEDGLAGPGEHLRLPWHASAKAKAKQAAQAAATRPLARAAAVAATAAAKRTSATAGLADSDAGSAKRGKVDQAVDAENATDAFPGMRMRRMHAL